MYIFQLNKAISDITIFLIVVILSTEWLSGLDSWIWRYMFVLFACLAVLMA